ncbi:RNA 2',3'-cyclic phosphodiesterase [Virgibacillus oceani]|uniref:RNA 2',3'-cyclic phosphodiesterase n=1 Tax=Virgibacillus oceani TaxID=1479511 RepID=A0A917HP22_9BACI|nr:RNA 2',3'-cyclic phosphodiesterase [Virgibacillus oceani]GGG84868.1 RNA 2',3'-cyclic phosphodiesterase [Virgibacillus oceani]
MNQLPHYFIAIPIPLSLKNMFHEWQNNLMKKLSYKQWPNKHDLHITLKFLGPVNESTLKTLQTNLGRIADLHPFTLSVGEIGTFGNPAKPRVLWAGVEKNENLIELHKEIEKCCNVQGFKKEQREYIPHITLAKKRKETACNNIEITNVKKDYFGVSYRFNVEEFVIYQIHPAQTQKYELVSRILFKGDNGNGTIN